MTEDASGLVCLRVLVWLGVGGEVCVVLWASETLRGSAWEGEWEPPVVWLRDRRGLECREAQWTGERVVWGWVE